MSEFQIGKTHPGETKVVKNNWSYKTAKEFSYLCWCSEIFRGLWSFLNFFRIFCKVFKKNRFIPVMLQNRWLFWANKSRVIKTPTLVGKPCSLPLKKTKVWTRVWENEKNTAYSGISLLHFRPPECGVTRHMCNTKYQRLCSLRLCASREVSGKGKKLRLPNWIFFREFFSISIQNDRICFMINKINKKENIINAFFHQIEISRYYNKFSFIYELQFLLLEFFPL